MRWGFVVMVVVAVVVLGYEERKKRRRGGVSDNMATHLHPPPIHRRGEAEGRVSRASTSAQVRWTKFEQGGLVGSSIDDLTDGY